MNNSKDRFKPAAAKKEIQKKMATFEERLFKAGNDFELACVLQDMERTLKSEIDNWILKVAESADNGIQLAKAVVKAANKIEDATGIDKGEEHITLIDRAAKFIGEFEELLTVIRTQLSEIHENAKEIERVYIRNHKLSAPVLRDLI